MLALISYLFYYKTKNKKFIIFTFGLFILSLLSKAQAVTLPPVLLLIDYYLVGKFSRKVILEKIPFFIVALIFGIIAIYAQKADNSVNPVGLSPYQSLFYGFYSVWVYLFKFILPVNLTCLYQYPFTAAGKVPLYVYFSPLILIFLAFILYKTWKSHTIIFFGVLFFLMTIFPVLQFLPVGQAVVAERYSYIPYIGLFIIAGSVFSEFRQKLPPVSGRKILIYLGVAVIIIFAILTWKRAAVWKDSIALWTDVMKKNPKSIDAYINRGYIYNQYDQYESGIKDCNDGIALDSNNYKLYINRAISYKMLGKYDLAVADFTKALEKNPQSYGTYLDRGIIYTDDLRQYNRGIADMKKFLKHSPEHVDGNYNLGVSYYKRGTYDSAMIFCQKALELSPKSGCSHYLCALLFGLKNDYLNAYTHAMEAKALGTSVDDALLKEWQQKSNLFIPPVPK